MTDVTIDVMIDDVLRQKLADFQRPVRIMDTGGKVLAYVRPVRYLDPEEWAPTPEPPITEEELDRLRKSTNLFTTAEVLAYLRSL